VEEIDPVHSMVGPRRGARTAPPINTYIRLWLNNHKQILQDGTQDEQIAKSLRTFMSRQGQRMKQVEALEILPALRTLA